MDDGTPEIPRTEQEYQAAMEAKYGPARPALTHEQKVERRLTVIAWSTSIVAVAVVLSAVSSFVLLSMLR